MRKALVVAGVEFRSFVRARSFLIGLLLPPVMGGVAMTATWLSRPHERQAPPALRIAVVDRSGSLFDPLEIAAAQRNGRLGLRETRFELESVDPDASEDAADSGAELARRVQQGELAAVVEIPADADTASDESVQLRVLGRDAVEAELAFWLESSVREELRTRALRRSGISNELRARLGRQVVASFEAPAPVAGEATDVAPDPDRAPQVVQPILHQLGPLQKLVIAAPLGFILMFAVTLSAAPLFQAVLEEKTSRVSEILLSSVSPFELMLGKLIGSLGACSIAALVYSAMLLGVLVLAFGAAIPTGLLLLFVAYLVFSLFLWGGIFLAIGAAVADTKDAQNLMLPVVMVQMLPMIFMSNLLASPGSAIARALSFFPPTAPMVMFVRLGHDPAPSVLEIALSLALLAAAALATVWAAGRVLRVGLLLQGRSASLREMARWVWAR